MTENIPVASWVPQNSEAPAELYPNAQRETSAGAAKVSVHGYRIGSAEVGSMQNSGETAAGATTLPGGDRNEGVLMGGRRIERVIIAGVAFSNVSMDEAICHIVNGVEQGGSHHVCTGNLDHLYLLQSDHDFQQAYATAGLVLADGMPVLWLSRLSGRNPLRERVAGSDLFWELARLSQERGMRLFFLGGAAGSAERSAQIVRERFPQAKIVGTYCPSFETFDSPEEQAAIAQRVQEAAPDILLVGFGAPKQEKWILANKKLLRVPVCIGVGGTFEMASGAVRRAPRWMQQVGLEWAFRMVQDPRRLWRRYLCNDLPFLMRLVWKMSRRSSSHESLTRGVIASPQSVSLIDTQDSDLRAR